MAPTESLILLERRGVEGKPVRRGPRGIFSAAARQAFGLGAGAGYSHYVEIGLTGRFAVIETPGREFTLVPWRPILERSLGKSVMGIMRGEGISWTITRSRSLVR